LPPSLGVASVIGRGAGPFRQASPCCHLAGRRAGTAAMRHWYGQGRRVV